jgi:hypothetical protein
VSTVIWANSVLLDRLLISADGEDVGVVDDLELSDAGEPELTAFLSGPTAFGPRLGGRLGVWWLAIGRRLRPSNDPRPNRVPVELVKSVDRRGITLNADADDLPTRRLHSWALTKVIGRIPGNGS